MIDDNEEYWRLATEMADILEKEMNKKMNIINLTPHTLNIFNEDGEEIAVLEPSGQVARVSVTREKLPFTRPDEIPMFTTRLGDIEGLPEPQEGTIFVVSGMFRSVCSRPDLWQPGELLRDDKGRPIGCVGLSQ